MSAIDARYLRGRPVADWILEAVRGDAENARAAGWPPTLVSITVGDTGAVDVYVRNQRRTAEKVGIDFAERRFSETVTAVELAAAIGAMNADPRVTGIIIQRPVPDHIPSGPCRPRSIR